MVAKHNSVVRAALACSVIAAFGAGCHGSAPATGRDGGPRRQMLWPKKLVPGDTIAFVAPAGDLDRERMALARQRLEARGYKVVQRDDLFAQEGYLAGSDERRAAELMQWFADPEVDAIFPGTGGYGTMRILDKLDYALIRNHPKLLIGFSDITGLHAAINRRAGVVTFHSPNPMWGLGSPDGLTPFSERWFFRAIEQQAGVGPYRLEIPTTFEPAAAASAVPTPAATGGPAGIPVGIPAGIPVSDAAAATATKPAVQSTESGSGATKLQPLGAWGKGRARGRLTGGNLSLVSALEGTPYAIDTRGAILLVEDVREAPYRVDRMLRQLQLAGKLAELRGAVLGQFTRNYDREDEARRPDPRYTVEGVLRQYFENAGIPVLYGFPLGHVSWNATLPLGGEVEIDADRQELRVLEGESTPWLDAVTPLERPAK